MAPELRVKAGKPEDEPYCYNGADVVNTDMDELNPFGDQVIAPVLLHIADNLRHGDHKGETDGHRGNNGMGKSCNADEPFCTDGWKFNVLWAHRDDSSR